MAKVVERLTNHPHIFHPEVGPALTQAVTLAENLGQSPILGGNAVEMLVDYDETIARLVADIDGAKDHVHLLFYIFADDRATAPVIEALGRAAKRGVRCRVLADAIGSRAGLRTLRPQVDGAGGRGPRDAAGQPPALEEGPPGPAQPPQDRRHRRAGRLHRLAEPGRRGVQGRASPMKS